MTATSPDHLLTVADIADYLGVHESTIRGWIKAGHFAAYRFDGKVGYRIPRPALDAFLRRRSLTGAIAHHLLTFAPPGGN